MGLLEYLKKILGDEEGQKAFEKIKADNENVLLVDSKEESKYVEKSKLNDANSTIRDYKKQLKDRDKQLEDLKGKAEGNEDLTKEIEKLKGENKKVTEDYEAKLKEKDFNYALDRALTDAKVKNPKAVKALLNLENIKLDGNDLIGLKEQMEKVKESDSYLFEERQEGGTGTIGSNISSSTNTNDKEPKSLGEKLAAEKAEATKASETLNSFFK
ncbi:MAG: phage scaffolding protein [Anaeromicrobium sp.]|jgi:hypothetical protein|uniref:phage scaffolding protein n=1 Tax=Anaeromicrobium sp. TaxID=1929132 RepID=UPI0025EED1A9|nr:phage scaffolding protein [Anaeromicrobium sp.]MCT4593172.1 phage scaffolding protein [Anaeromicrobium sp.]